MLLNQLKPKHSNTRKRARVGRGGKRGTTAGKGTKGQRARSGHRIRPAVRDYIQRLPKLRGYKNKPKSDKAAAVNVGDLEKLANATISLASLVAAGLVHPRTKAAKVLGDGELKRSITLEGLKVSKEAKKKIEAAGGKIVEIKEEKPMEAKK